MEKDIVKIAKELASEWQLTKDFSAGSVACTLETESGNLFTGINLEGDCGIGTCAEHGAIHNMIVNKESKINKIVAVTDSGTILPPCGRCRELIYQINAKNTDTEIILEDRTTTLNELLPDRWQESYE